MVTTRSFVLLSSRFTAPITPPLCIQFPTRHEKQLSKSPNLAPFSSILSSQFPFPNPVPNHRHELQLLRPATAPRRSSSAARLSPGGLPQGRIPAAGISAAWLPGVRPGAAAAVRTAATASAEPEHRFT